MFTILVIFLSVSSGVYAQNVTGNSTVPVRVGWVPTNPGRSTMDIVWSCFSVLLICSYKCIHVNLPTFEEKHAKWHSVWGIPIWPHKLVRQKAYRKINLMALILLAPEIGVGMALAQYLGAKMELEDARKAVPEMELTLTHGFYATMGGFGCTIPASPQRVASNANSYHSQFDESATFLALGQRAHLHPVHYPDMREFDEPEIEDDKALLQGGSRLGTIGLASYGKHG